MNAAQLEALGQIVESAANYEALTMLPMPTEVHFGALLDGMRKLRDEARRLYVEVSGDDPWDGHPSFPPLPKEPS